MQRNAFLRAVAVAVVAAPAAAAASGCQGVIGLTDYKQGESTPASPPASPADGGQCAADACRGTDGQCYGPCDIGTCTLVGGTGTCSDPSAGGVYCCVPTTSTGGTGCDQTCLDDSVAFSIDSTLIALYNQLLAGHAAGTISVSGACPASGTVTITGTDSVTKVSGGDDVAFQLTFAMTQCGVTGSSYSISLTGSVTQQGTFPAGSTPGSNDWVDTAHQLVISAVLSFGGNVAETCDVALTNTWDHDPSATGWLKGSLCGRAVSE
ncbi:MAG TPA: hypothetical protein VIF09_18200 [Polyangiaceae bacterium]